MKLTPTLIRKMNEIAHEHRDEPFLAIKSVDCWFVCNWVFGLAFSEKDVLNCPAFDMMVERGNNACDDPVKLDILHHIYKRSWMDVLVGQGLMQDVELVQLHRNESEIFEEKGWPVIPFEAQNGRRYYIRELYFDLAEEVLGDMTPVIFRPINSPAYPSDYRPMVFIDDDNQHLGMVYAITDENLLHPIDREQEYARYVQATMPELFRG